jgi:hypothetical protein
MSKNLLFFILGNLLLFALVYLTRKKRRINNLLLVFSTIFLLMSVIETTYRNFFNANNRYLQPFPLKPDSLLGTRIAASGVFHPVEQTASGKTIFHATYTIIADSDNRPLKFPHRIGYQDPGSPDPKIIFLGCSFTFGQGVNDSESLPYKFGALENVSTLNLGGIGYGIHHVYKIFLDNYANRDNSNKTFIYTLIPDHVLRGADVYSWSTGPSFRLSGDSLLYTGTLPAISNKPAYYASFFGCYSVIKDMVTNIAENNRARSVSPEEYQKAYVQIRNMDRYSKATGGHFVLLFWDKDSKPGDPNSDHRPLLEARLEQLRKDGVIIIRVSDIINTQDPRYYIPLDGHPDSLADDAVARYLAKRTGPGQLITK